MVNSSLTKEARKMGKRQSFQQVLLGNLDSCLQINETRTHPHTMHQNKLKMAERLKCKTRHHQTPSREHRQNVSDINHTSLLRQEYKMGKREPIQQVVLGKLGSHM